MTKHEQRTYVLSIVSIACVVVLGLYTHFSARAYVVNDDLIETINTKASITYVDKGDAVLNESIEHNCEAIKDNATTIKDNDSKNEERNQEMYDMILDLWKANVDKKK